MPRTYSPGIGTQIFTATPQPKMGDREDFLLRIQGPDPSTDFQVALSITGTALALWGNPNPADAAEELGEAIYKVSGTAGQPPPEGYWFDSYNSDYTLQETVNIIANEGALPFIKNRPEGYFVKGLGQDVNVKIQELDKYYTQKFAEPFFTSLEDISEESQRVNDLNTPATNNAEYLYRISILSGIIDHINVHVAPEDAHICNECHQRHRQSEGSLQGLRRWLADKIDQETADRLTLTLQMLKNLRKQYPIHDHYTTANNIRQVRGAIENANTFFGIRDRDYGHNATVVVNKFSEALDQIKAALEDITP